MNINQLAKEIHEQNVAVGWWGGNPDVRVKLQLVSTEIAEATEGERKDIMDDHLPHRKMGEVELADALIRVLDFGERLGLSFSRTKAHGADTFFPSLADDIFVKHFKLNILLSRLGVAYCLYESRGLEGLAGLEIQYSTLVYGITCSAHQMGYDIEGAVGEKLAYNKTRSDHKRENRAKKNGKKV